MSPHATLDERERRDRLRLIRCESVGPVTWRRLIERFGSAGRAIEALPDLARRGGRHAPLALPSLDEIEHELRALAHVDARLLVLGEAAYPPALAAIEDAPPTLAVRGNVEVLSRCSVAIVGSRNASISGSRLAGTLAADLGRAGLVVVSGMARGIDSAAHRGALPTGTVAVLAGGIDVVYPPENAELYAAIVSAGAVVAELPPTSQPLARHFPRRNRIIAGLSSAVLVVEAGLRSGSLITARFALEQGRDVFAVPGSPLDPRSRGGNDLIRQGAVLTETADDVLSMLLGARDRIVAEPVTPTSPPEDEAEQGEDPRRLIAALLSPTPVSVDEIIRTCQLSPAIVTTILLEWELAGQLERHPGNRVSVIVSGSEQA
ncbi:MAG: DNA-processing protein DprA [Rhodospirillales bacterium]